MSQAKLIKGLGFLGLVAATFNCTVGGGIFKLPEIVYKLVGTASPIVYLLCFLVMLLIVAVFVVVGSETTDSGGPYAYVEPVLGSYLGFLCGILLWLLGVFAMASVSTAYASFTSSLIPVLDNPGGRALILGVTLAAFAVLNSMGVKSGSRVSVILSIAKLLPLLLLIAVGIPHLDSASLALPSQMDTGSIARATMMLVFAFAGAECALIPSGEIENPKRTLPRALYTALFGVLALYLLVQAVAQSALAGDLANTGGAPLVVAAERLMGPSGRLILAIGAALSTAGFLSAMMMGLPRSLLAFAEKGYLPAAFRNVNGKSHAPVAAIWTQGALTFVLAISNGFEGLAILANLSAILLYALCAVAAIRMKRNEGFSAKKLIPWLALVPMAFLLTSVTQGEWMSEGAFLLIATVLYIVKNRLATTK
jgi:APA family basic amino acid/polyamine antiporter